MEKSKSQLGKYLSIAVFFTAFATFFSTMAPTVSFWDCGEYIASSFSLGIPHPPGNPLFVLIGRVFTMIFFWTEQVAFRVNLISVFSGAFSAFFIFKIIEKAVIGWIGEPDEYWKQATVYVSAMVGGLFAVLNYTVWFSAVETSVYLPSLLVVIINVYISLIWSQSKDENRDRYLLLFSYLAFLGIGIHMMSMFAMIPIFLYIIVIDTEKLKDWRLWGIALLLGAVIYSVSAFIYIAPILLVMSAIYAYAPKDIAKILNLALAVLLLFVRSKAVFGTSSSPLIDIAPYILMLGLTIMELTSKESSESEHRHWKFPFYLVLFAVLGYSVHAYIPIRSALEPMIDENHPIVEWKDGKVKWDAFKGFLERKQYGSESMITRMFHRRGALSTQFGFDGHMGYGGFHLTQFFHFGDDINVDRRADSGNTVINAPFHLKMLRLFLYLLPTFFVFWAFGYWYKHDRDRAILFISLATITTIALVLYMNFSDGKHLENSEYKQWKNAAAQSMAAGQPAPQKPANVHREVRIRDYFYTAGFAFFGMWIGLAVAALLHFCFTSENVFLKKKLAPILVVLFAISPALPFSQNYSESNRSNDWIPYDYAFNLLMSCEKDGILFTNGDNDTFPLWFLQEAEGIRKDVRIVNLSLVNTKWYIKQLKKLKPIVPISYTEKEIDTKVTHMLNPFKEPILYPLKKAGISVVPPTQAQKRVLRVQDMMVLNIVDANAWEKPVYFSVTVSESNLMGLSPYLQMEGMVYRVHPKTIDQNDRINFERSAHLLDNVYNFRNLGNNKTPLSETARKLMNNYTAAFIQYSSAKAEQIGDAQAKLEEIEKQLSIEFSDSLSTDSLSLVTQKDSLQLFVKEGSSEVINKMDKAISVMPWDLRSRAFRHEFLISINEFELAKKRMNEALTIEPNNSYYKRWAEQAEAAISK
jgi:hypothetical protein